MQPDEDEAILRVGIALAILRALKSGAMDIESLRRETGRECGWEAEQRYFGQVVDYLVKGNYLREVAGLLCLNGKGQRSVQPKKMLEGPNCPRCGDIGSGGGF